MKRAFFVVALVAAPLLADNINLRGGGRLSGEIVAQTDDVLTIDIGAGHMTVPRSSVVSVERGTSPLQEYRARADALAGSDIDGWRTLARWAEERGLSAQAHDAWSRVHAASPDDPEATRALGLVLHEGRWVPEEEALKARGYVKYGGDWMMPAERDAMIRERDARDEANRQAVAEVVKTSEADRKAREAEEARIEEEQKRRNQLPTLGDSFGWGWGWGYSVPTVGWQ